MNKVLAIAPYNYLPYSSGGQKFIAQFLEHLGKETDLTVITVPENDLSLAMGYKLLPLLKKKPFYRYTDPGLVSKIVSLTMNENFNAIIWEHPYYGWLAHRVKKRTGKKTIIHTHNIEHKRFHSTGKWWWWILKIYEKWSLKFADYIFFITQEDKDFAITKWKINPEKCIEVPFGIDIRKYPNDRMEAKEMIHAKHNIPANEKIFLFNGVLDYKPNLNALLAILKQINPLLLQQAGFRYKIIICGKRLPPGLNGLQEFADKNIIYAGFVDDIETYFKAADLFLNPVQAGGGIKTKMVEAIAYGATVIGCKTGAAGINKDVCGDKLIIIPDNNWQEFTKSILNNAHSTSLTPLKYYDHYFWGNIIQNTLTAISRRENV